ncbi:MAG: winged helix-turn-helix domain-containing protein [Alphaproteobacteria bacterium]|nr:winged helix-turn-helix domain-containing protein [Alphaproteobacteria bacterium]
MTDQNDHTTGTVDLGAARYNRATKALVHAGKTIPLEDKIAELLDYFLARQGEVVSKDDILETIWAGRSLSEQTVPVAISKLRKALREAGCGDDILKTIPKRGYQLAVAEQMAAPVVAEGKGPGRIWMLAAAFGVLIIAILLWPTRAPLVPAAGAEKPGMILTMKDIRTSLQGDEAGNKVIALSELASYYLSQTPEVLLIRHWWNFDAPDPTGGIFTRYGKDTPVYLLTGNLIEDGGKKLVTLSLSYPGTDEVIWSGLHDVADGSGRFFAVLADMYKAIGVFPTEAASTASEEDDRYWVGRFLMHLGSPGAAKNAGKMWQDMLADDPDNATVRLAYQALAARWQLEGADAGAVAASGDAGGYQSLVDEAAAVFFGGEDNARALTLIDDAIRGGPSDHYAWALKAEILAAGGDKDGALAAYRKAARLAPFSRPYEERVAALTPVTDAGPK